MHVHVPAIGCRGLWRLLLPFMGLLLLLLAVLVLNGWRLRAWNSGTILLWGSTATTTRRSHNTKGLHKDSLVLC